MSRVNDLVQRIGTIGRNEDGSITRTGGTPLYHQAVELVRAELQALGLQAEVDPVGNVHGVLPGKNPQAKSIVLGSHLDTVIQGGVYDGVLGVAGALEVLHRLREENLQLDHTLEVWGFNLEESSPVGGTFGSRAVAGMVDVDARSTADHLHAFGFDRDKVLACKQDISRYGCYLELHIEQGDLLEAQNIPIGVVSGIVSIIRYNVTATGMSNHAGTTMMHNRRDAMVGMSRLIVESDRLAREIDDTLVLTVGKLSVSPGQENVIPGQVVACFEMRHMQKAVTDRLIAEIQQAAAQIGNCDFSFENTIAKYATPCDPAMVKQIDDVCTRNGIPHIVMPSGAGHDANPMAHEGIPIGMIFVPSRGGISHNGAEYTSPEQIDLGADVLYQTVLELDRTL